MAGPRRSSSRASGHGPCSRSERGVLDARAHRGGDSRRQAHAPLRRSRAVERFESGVDLVALDVHVRDLQGRVVSDLDALDFVVRENGVPQDVAMLARSRDLPMDAVLVLDRSLEHDRTVAMLSRPLRQLAIETGAQAIAVTDATTLPQWFRHIGEEVRSLYRLGYVSSDWRKDGAWRRVQAQVPGVAAKVRTRTGYCASAPCSAGDASRPSRRGAARCSAGRRPSSPLSRFVRTTAVGCSEELGIQQTPSAEPPATRCELAVPVRVTV